MVPCLGPPVLGYKGWPLSNCGKIDIFGKISGARKSRTPAGARSSKGSLGTEVYLFKERVSLSPAVRGIFIDNRAIDGTPFDDTPLVNSDTSHQHALTPRVGLKVDLTDNWVLKTTFAQTLRPPDLAELFGDRGGIVGNAALVPEEASQIDGGFRWTPQGAWWQGSADLSVFYKQAQNLIVYEQNSQRTMTPRNVGQSHVYGAELSLQTNWKEWLDLRLNLSRVESENREADPAVNGMQLPRIPALSLFQSLTVHLHEFLSVGQQWSFTDGNYWDATNWYRSAPRSIHGAFIQGQFKPFGHDSNWRCATGPIAALNRSHATHSIPVTQIKSTKPSLTLWAIPCPVALGC